MHVKRTTMRYVLCLLLLAGTFACQKDRVGPERAAVVSGQDGTLCGGCGGWFVDIVEGADTARYRADVPSPFNQAGTPVWIRYERDLSDGLKEYGRWIKIRSIRSREAYPPSSGKFRRDKVSL